MTRSTLPRRQIRYVLQDIHVVKPTALRIAQWRRFSVSTSCLSDCRCWHRESPPSPGIRGHDAVLDAVVCMISTKRLLLGTVPQCR